MTKITELGAATTPLDPTDLIEVVQQVGTTPVNKKATVARLAAGGVPAYEAHRAAPAGEAPLWADEFNGTSLDATWQTVVPTGTLSASVGRGVLSLGFNAQAASDMAGVGQPLPAGLPAVYAIECDFRAWNFYQNYLMAGPFISNGLATTSNVMWWMPFTSAAANAVNSFRGGTIDNVATNYGDLSALQTTHDHHLVRLVIDTPANTIRVERSLDGVRWTLAGAAAFSRALAFAPTHFGFGVSTWGANNAGVQKLAAVDYIRIYAV